MKAFFYTQYGSPQRILSVETIDIPVPANGQVLVKVRAAAANAMDYYFMNGIYLIRPFTGFRGPRKARHPGGDVAGEVVSVGKNVTRFKSGDYVFGVGRGAFAEFVVTPETKLVHKGDALSFEDAAAIPVAAMTALQGLRDRARIQPGQSVLINGAAGGIGTYAIQIAKHLGAEVTAVCSTRNVELVKSLGADDVIDYTKMDFTRSGNVYDVLFDIIGNHPMSQMLRVLRPKGTFVPVGVRKGGPWLGPIPRLLSVLWAHWFASQRVTFFVANINVDDLMVMRDLVEKGKVRSVIDSVYPFEEMPLAMEHLMEGHARGKVVVAM